ncbi:MAG: hypothetical protein WAO72_01480 [Syntrophomonadaceae bacterium]
MDTMQSFRQAQSQPDLFQVWRQEAELRQQLREQPVTSISTVQSEEDVDFLLRALYFGGRTYDFFMQLSAVLSNAAALRWWKSSPEWLKEEFFSYLATQLANHDADVKKFQFLIHLYEPGLHNGYKQLVSQLNLQQCRYLLSKTANQSLRSLLKTREEEIVSGQKRRYYGLLSNKDFDGFELPPEPEKWQLIKEALLQLEQTRPQYCSEPWGTDRLSVLLNTIDKVYQCGLIEDAFLLIGQVYRAYENQQRLQEVLQDERLGTKLTRLISKIVGTKVLLGSDPRLSYQTDQFYQLCFPALDKDPQLQAMLNLYEAILSSPNQVTHLPWEILSRYETLMEMYPESNWPELGLPEAVPDAGARLLEAIHTLINSSPHDAFIFMELARIMARHSLIFMDKQEREQLLSYYISMWKWVPSPRFLSVRILEDLTHQSGVHLRQEAERILSWSAPGKPASLLTDLQKRPDLYRGGLEPIRGQALFGFLLGVLE